MRVVVDPAIALASDLEWVGWQITDPESVDFQSYLL